MMDWFPEDLARTIDYTEVRKEVTYADIERVCLEAQEAQIAAVVVGSALIRKAARCLAGTGITVSCCIGYPFGTQAAAVKAREAEVATEHGATELEVVAHQGGIRASRWADVEAELRAVREASAKSVLKLVVEAGYLSEQELMTVARLGADLGYTWIANTAGFRVVSTSPQSQTLATPEMVDRLWRASAGRIRPKAVGGIHTLADLQKLVVAGATRVAIAAEPGILSRLAGETRNR